MSYPVADPELELKDGWEMGDGRDLLALLAFFLSFLTQIGLFAAFYNRKLKSLRVSLE